MCKVKISIILLGISYEYLHRTYRGQVPQLTVTQEMSRNFDPRSSYEADVVKTQEIWEPGSGVQGWIHLFQVVQRQGIVIAS